jgi:large subunit ribosomal protein L5
MKSETNPMRQVRLEKVTLNMGAGDSVQRVEASKKVLEVLAGRKVVITKTRKRTTFGIARGRKIGAKVTIRKKEGEEILKRLMKAVENRITPSHFDSSGNFSFGIKEYIHIPGASYDPDIGILGLDVAVTLERPGFSVKKRKAKKGRIGKKHAISREESMEWARKFGFKIEEKEEEKY